MKKIFTDKDNLYNFISFIMPKLISLGIYALTVPYFINNVGEKKYGILILVLVIFNYLYLLDFGIGYAIIYRFTRKLAVGSSSALSILSKGIPFYLVSSAIFGGLLFLLSDRLSEWFFGIGEYALLFKLMAFCCFLLMLSYLFTGILTAYNRVYMVNCSNLVLDLIKSLSLVVGVFYKGSLVAILITIILGTIVKLGLDIWFVFVKVGHLKWLRPHYSLKELAFNIKLGSPMLVVLLFALIANSVDKIFVGKFFSLQDVAYYSIAADLNVKAYFLFAAVNGTMATLLIRQTAMKKNKLTLIGLSLIACLLITLFYYLPLAIFSYRILAIWIGQTFASNAYLILRIMSIASVSYMVYDIFYNIYQTSGRFKINAFASLIGAVTLAILLFILPKYFGLSGVAYSMVGMYWSMIVFLATYLGFNSHLVLGRSV